MKFLAGKCFEGPIKGMFFPSVFLIWVRPMNRCAWLNLENYSEDILAKENEIY